MQTFLFEELPADIQQKTGILIDNCIRSANDFRCKLCKHKGPLQPDPAFTPVDSKNISNEDFKMVKTEKELLKEELVCF